MDHPFLPVAIVLVLLAWAIVAVIIHQRGSGIPNRSVRCPDKDVRARISVLFYNRPGAPPAQEREVMTCSLIGEGPITCDKTCLTQL